MKRLYNYMLLAIMALATVGCAEEMNEDFPSAESGDEVQFGLSLPGMTRTIYGDRTGDAYPIYWVNGDKVKVYSPQCLADRNMAEYKVSAGEKQNYATALIPTGDYGVQWASEDAHFYSVYPSGDYTIASDGNSIQNLRINFSDEFEVVDGKVTPKQADCLMFAKTQKKLSPGSEVKLTYSPMATAVMFTLYGPTDDNNASTNIAYEIQSVKLIAPVGTDIAGHFDAKVATSGDNIGKWVFDKWAENGQKTNVIEAKIFEQATGGNYKIKEGEPLKLALFLVPREDLTITKDWKIEIHVQTTSDSGQPIERTFRKSLEFENDVDTALKPGMVHELPTLPNLDMGSGTAWEPGNWMERIPRNVYLSEVSIPGTWNSLNSDCQLNTSINSQYQLGVRAFHLDTRWKASRNGNLGQIIDPTITALSVCDGTTSYSVVGASGRVNGTSAQTFQSCLETIVRNVKEDEYMVVFCTFAQDSYSGAKCPSTWMQAISDACDNVYNNTDAVLNGKIFDGSKITENTLVGDVVNRVLVIVNLDKPLDDCTLPINSKCLFTYVPMRLSQDHYTGTNANVDSHIDPLYYATKESSGISMYTSHAQISTTNASAVNCGDRGYAHLLTNRDALINGIWDWSRTNYNTSNYKHDHWIYIGLGGYIMNSSGSNGTGYNTIENRYAPMVYNRIDEMGQNNVPYYPVGIVLMNNKLGGNYTTTSGNNTIDLGYGFSDICNKILLLNSKYRLQYDPNKPSDYKPNA